MKRYTSRFLKTVALFYLAFPLTYLVIVAVLFDVPANYCLRILLWPFYYIVASMAVITGFGFWEMRRWAWYLFVPVNVLIAYENAIIANDYGESHHQAIAFVASVLLLAVLTYRVAREVRVPYFFPKIRWWESNPRYRLSSPVKVSRTNANGGNAEPIDAEILDLSMGGCFIKLRTDLSEDEMVAVDFTTFGHRVQCTGNVVWRTASTVTHPKGVGVKFGLLDRNQKRSLRQITKRLKEIAAFYRRSRYLMNQEEFMKRLEELEAKLDARKESEQRGTG